MLSSWKYLLSKFTVNACTIYIVFWHFLIMSEQGDKQGLLD